jgi:hypothetical protein
MPRSHKILFFSRGRGHGHAVIDGAIAKALHSLERNLDISFVSYSTGAVTHRTMGRDALDLGLPEANPFVATLLKVNKVLSEVRPTIIIAHEEFAALIGAALNEIKCIYIAAWLPPVGSLSAETLTYADSIIVLGENGLFPVLPGLRTSPVYVGTFQRKVSVTFRDRKSIRLEEGIPPNAICIVVATGGDSSEQENPISDVVLDAFRLLKAQDKRLFWISAKDFNLMSKKLEMVKGARAYHYTDPIERMFAMSNVIITKGTRGVTMDAAAVGVPSISLSSGKNSVDDFLVPRIRSNIPLVRKAVDSEVLLEYIMKALDATYEPAITNRDSTTLAAQEILKQLNSSSR